MESDSKVVRINVRLPEKLLSRLKAHSAEQGRSNTSHINILMAQSLSCAPVIASAPDYGPATSKPFGIRLSMDLHEGIRLAAAQRGRSMNTELIMRLATATAELEGSVQADVQCGQVTTTPSEAWRRLDSAISSMLAADVWGLAKAASDLQEARNEYEAALLFKETDQWQPG